MAYNKNLREGISTGSCAAAAAKAAAMKLLNGVCPQSVEIAAPGGRILTIPVQDTPRGCGVVKDAGDDPDATDGLLILAQVELGGGAGEITFAGGEGVGTVTLPGLKIPPGEPAINPVPRAMITSALRSVIGAQSALVTISVPGGEETAKRTFNPRLGVTGGISILGTTGIVRPMNEESIFESLTLELNTHAAAGQSVIAIAFGNTGEQAMRKAFGFEGRCAVQCGNYIGYMLDEAARLGFKRALLCGHPGKLLKVAAGSFNTHNRTGDGRLEALCTQAAIAGASSALVRELYECMTTENAMRIVRQNGLDGLWTTLAGITAKRCTDRSFGEMPVEAAYVDNDGKILGESDGAENLAAELRKID